MTHLRRWLNTRWEHAAELLEAVGDCPEPNDPTHDPKGPS